MKVFRATSGDLEKVVGWRTDMLKRGWKLLRVSSDANEIVAVFGKDGVPDRAPERALAAQPSTPTKVCHVRWTDFFLRHFH